MRSEKFHSSSASFSAFVVILLFCFFFSPSSPGWFPSPPRERKRNNSGGCARTFFLHVRATTPSKSVSLTQFQFHHPSGNSFLLLLFSAVVADVVLLFFFIPGTRACEGLRLAIHGANIQLICSSFLQQHIWFFFFSLAASAHETLHFVSSSDFNYLHVFCLHYSLVFSQSQLFAVTSLHCLTIFGTSPHNSQIPSPLEHLFIPSADDTCPMLSGIRPELVSHFANLDTDCRLPISKDSLIAFHFRNSLKHLFFKKPL